MYWNRWTELGNINFLFRTSVTALSSLLHNTFSRTIWRVLIINYEYKRFWRWCITHRITGFPDFVLRPEFEKLETTRFRKLDPLPSSDEGRKHGFRWVPYKEVTSITGRSIEVSFLKGPNRVGFSLSLPKNENIQFPKLCAHQNIGRWTNL
jgi:hypothetical protein